MTPHLLLSRLLAAAALLGAACGTPALAERADRDQPLNFAADRLRYDDARQVNVLSGNVVLNKGSMVIRAAQVEVRQTPAGDHQAVAVAADGQRAFFRQKREGLDEHLEGEAQRLEYDSGSDTLRMSGNAVIRRYRGKQLADEVSGQTIVFDNAAEVFSVAGGAEGGDGRVRGVLSPRRAGTDAPRGSSR
ncbi:lipopolysaccharide transport periplasmic protein LptA [Caldimonas tepidiphila]|uniref:lipopolysaccharide transport periplasmic protein LptA n=1 Tax=Caldimonas tepidiphila TaxID=2315841 RepID=UPI000E5B936D|nr:lipopolysaccharide transport periplasmic protein LptA [Caldimonas tepidiphila]